MDNFYSFATDSILTSMHETELITALREGDKSALGIVYDRYSAALYGVVLRIVQLPEMAEDSIW